MSYRKRGYTFVQIAQTLGCEPSTAHGFVVEALEAKAPTEVEALRRLECARLGDMMVKSFEGALTGDTGSIDAVIKIMDRRAKLLGREIRILNQWSKPDGWYPPAGQLREGSGS